ncbi:hypothetical protein V565_192870, partial [Rhizoctonia solani 123E]
MPKSLRSLTKGPILEDYDGTDFKVRYIDNGTNVQIIWNNGEERTYSVIPKPQNVSTCKLEQMMDCGEGRTEPHSTYLNIHAKMRHDTNAVTNGQAMLLSQFEEAELDTILTSRRAKDFPVSQPAPTQKKAKISAPRADMSRNDSRANGLDQGPQKPQAIATNRNPANSPLSAPETAWSVKWDRRPDVRPISAPQRSRSAVGDPPVVRGAVPPVTARPAEVEMQNGDGPKGHCDKSGDMILVAESMSWI